MQIQRYKKTEHGEIPEDWNILNIDQLTLEKEGIKTGPFGSSLKKEIFTKNGYKIYGQENVIPDDFSIGNYYIPENIFLKMQNYEIKPGDVLISLVGTHGKVSIVPNDIERGIINPRLLRIRLEKSKVIPEFIKILLESENIKSQIKKLSHGLTMDILNTKTIRQLYFIIPLISEQKKIASILSNIDSLIQKTDQIIEQSQRLKKGLMQRLLTKGMGHTKFKKTELGEIPEEWDIICLGDGLDLCQYGLSFSLSDTGQYPILRMNNIENGYMINKNLKYIDLDDIVFKRYRLEKEDILINRTNSLELVGKLGIFLLDGDYTFASYLIRLRTKKDKLDSCFLNFYLNIGETQDRLKNLATPGVSQANINATNLKTLKIPLPTIHEQQKIATIVSNVDDLAQKLKSKRKSEEILKRGLMQQLLTGKIRVKV